MFIDPVEPVETSRDPEKGRTHYVITPTPQQRQQAEAAKLEQLWAQLKSLQMENAALKQQLGQQSAAATALSVRGASPAPKRTYEPQPARSPYAPASPLSPAPIPAVVTQEEFFKAHNELVERVKALERENAELKKQPDQREPPRPSDDQQGAAAPLQPGEWIEVTLLPSDELVFSTEPFRQMYKIDPEGQIVLDPRQLPDETTHIAGLDEQQAASKLVEQFWPAEKKPYREVRVRRLEPAEQPPAARSGVSD